MCHTDGDIPELRAPGTLGSWAVGRGLLPGSPWAGEEEEEEEGEPCALLGFFAQCLTAGVPASLSLDNPSGVGVLLLTSGISHLWVWL